MNNLHISFAEVSECAAAIRALNNQMYELLMKMKSDMNETNVSWISDAGEAIRANFNRFAARFDKQKETIDSYAKFLDLTVSSYGTLESTMTSNAEGIQY